MLTVGLPAAWSELGLCLCSASCPRRRRHSSSQMTWYSTSHAHTTPGRCAQARLHARGVPAGLPRLPVMSESLLQSVPLSNNGSGMRARACRGSHAQLITLPAELIELATQTGDRLLIGIAFTSAESVNACPENSLIVSSLRPEHSPHANRTCGGQACTHAACACLHIAVQQRLMHVVMSAPAPDTLTMSMMSIIRASCDCEELDVVAQATTLCR